MGDSPRELSVSLQPRAVISTIMSIAVGSLTGERLGFFTGTMLVLRLWVMLAEGRGENGN
jgi:hypothetical protein